MQVKTHLLFDDGAQVPIVKSPNVGGVLKPQYLVMHYTASRNAKTAIETLIDPAAKVSAHLVISRAGEITRTHSVTAACSPAW